MYGVLGGIYISTSNLICVLICSVRTAIPLFLRAAAGFRTLPWITIWSLSGIR